MTDPTPTPTKKIRRRQTAERRAWVRYRPRRLEAIWHLFGIKPPQAHSAQIEDISTQGVGILADCSFAQGSILVLRFPGTSLETRQILVRVKYLQALENGQYKVGCTFVVPLSEEQLAELI